AKLVSTGVPKESIVAFTFTENAAEELKFRIRKHLQELQPDDPEIGDMFVGTIHSFCYKLLQDFIPRYKAHDVLDEHKRVLFVSTYDNARRIGLKNLFKRSYRNFEKFCLNVDVVREEMIDPKHLPEEFRKCYQNYIKLLNEGRFLDFSGMMHLVYHYLLTDVEFATKVFDRIQYVIVDEYQDINPLQEKLIELLTERNGNLCVVGDDDQCIYQWRGTNVDNILTFTKRYMDVEAIEITTNFRSSEVIVNSAKEVIERNFERLPKEISSWDNSKITFQPGDIYAINFESNLQELEFVLEKIKSLRGKKYINNRGEEYAIDYRDMAIFFRSVKNSADPYIQAFKDHNIPFIVKGGGKLFEQEEVLLVVKSIAFLGNFTFAGPTTINELARLYNDCFGSLGDADQYLQQMQSYKSTKSPEDYISLQGIFQMILSLMGATKFEFSETQLYNLGMLSQTITDFEAIYKRIMLKGIKYFLG
ncbi:MAG: ATP-dependent helicase, partial [Candidatus Heimdallarchaeota archaeon]|nr:ATP-dependent helicase [Candidatus Heimdallarchaeota archaeon]